MPTTQTAIIALAAAAAAALLWRRRRRRVPPPGPQQPPLVLDARMLDRVLSSIEEAILPQTKTQLARGNKMFGAAVLDAFTGDTVVAATNLETACPIHHGEVVAIEAWSKLKKRVFSFRSCILSRTSTVSSSPKSPMSKLATSSGILFEA